jgi:K+-transporting ATPase ATPase A chain
MELAGWLQMALFLGLLAAVTRPMGLYLFRVLESDGKTWLDRPVKLVEHLFYRVLGIDAKKEQDWRHYSRSLIVFSLAGLLFTYAVLRLQHILPLNPQKFGPVRPDLAFNTAASFTTNTNWQNYAGETTLSYFSQMVGLVFHNFVSAAAGIAAATALVRGIVRHSAKTVGNFWVDLIRVNLYLLLPFSIVFSVFLTSQGVVQNFKPAVKAAIVESTALFTGGKSAAVQTIAQGPAASQVAIKILGTNGGGFFKILLLFQTSSRCSPFFSSRAD